MLLVINWIFSARYPLNCSGPKKRLFFFFNVFVKNKNYDKNNNNMNQTLCIISLHKSVLKFNMSSGKSSKSKTIFIWIQG